MKKYVYMIASAAALVVPAAPSSTHTHSGPQMIIINEKLSHEVVGLRPFKFVLHFCWSWSSEGSWQNVLRQSTHVLPMDE